MYKVMIVDDEMLIRKGLRETIEWDVLGIEVVAEAGNGSDAMFLIETLKPDIVITDIMMPSMNGIQLIEWAKQQGLETKFIILSGYNDYEYLKAAIEMDVESYLLKPINQKELIYILKSAVEDIESENGIRLINQYGYDALKRKTMMRLMTHQISRIELKEKDGVLNIGLKDVLYRVVICQFGFINEHRQMLLNIEASELLTLFSSHSECTGTFLDNSGRIVFLCDLASTDALEVLLKKLEQKVMDQFNCQVLFSVGQQVAMLSAYLSYDKALSNIEYGIFHTSISYVCDNMNPFNESVSRVDTKAIEHLIKSKDQEALNGYCMAYLEDLIHYNQPLEYIRNKISELATCLIRSMDRALSLKRIEVSAMNISYNELAYMNRVDDFKTWIENLVGTVFNELSKHEDIMPNRLIKYVLDYSMENYNKDVSLKRLSIDLGVNTSYLGQLFKKEMNQTYVEFMNNYRVNKAIELLRDSNLKVYEISKAVGFTNYQYFHKIFKKYSGKTSSEYR